MTDTKKLILDVSLKLFLQKSFKDVTMKEIVEGTGLSKGTFYYYFDSKEKVFEEVINFFLKDFMSQDYNQFPQDTLKSFYTAYLKDTSEKTGPGGDTAAKFGEAFNFNHYYLIFDALRMLPSFKKSQVKHNLHELNSWKKIISVARAKGEIRSKMTDEQIAQIFIFMGDGFGMRLIMKNSLHKIGDLKYLYDGFYSSLTH